MSQADRARKQRRAVFERIRRSVVAVAHLPLGTNRKEIEGALGSGMAKAVELRGSGFVIDDFGRVVTAKHVVAPILDPYRAAIQRGEPISVPLALVYVHPFNDGPRSGFEYEISLVANVSEANELDVAVLTPPPVDKGRVRPQPIAMARQPAAEGDEVIICGYPLGNALHADQLHGSVVRPSFSQGIVSAVLPWPGAPAEMSNVFQIDGTVNGGNSGGPVVDLVSGEVVGIAIATMSRWHLLPGLNPNERVRLEIPTGLARAIPVALVRRVVNDSRARAGLSPL